MEDNDLEQLPSIGIILPVRENNNPALLQRALNSIVMQSYQNWHLVIFNHSKDKNYIDNILILFKEKFPNIALDEKIIVADKEKSLSTEAANNQAIVISKTDYLVIYSERSTWSPEFLQRMIHILLKEKKVLPSVQGIVCYSHLVNEEINGNIIQTNHVSYLNSWIEPGIIAAERMLLDNMFPRSSFIFSRTAWEALKGFDDNLPILGDWEFNIRFLLSYDIFVLPEFLAFDHQQSSITGGYNGDTAIEKYHYAVYRKYIINKYIRELPHIGLFMAQKQFFEEIEFKDDNIFSDTEKQALSRVNFVYEKLRAIYRLWQNPKNLFFNLKKKFSA